MTLLTELLKQAGMTQRQLADEVGVSENTVIRWMMTGANARRPREPELRLMARILGVKPEEIELPSRQHPRD